MQRLKGPAPQSSLDLPLTIQLAVHMTQYKMIMLAVPLSSLSGLPALCLRLHY